jgi:hypothetical protein
MALILLGLAVIVMPASLWSLRGARSAPKQSRSTDA